MVRPVPFCFLVLLGAFAVPSSSSQEPIRVQSHEVLVPTVVFDKELYAQFRKTHHRDSYDQLIARDTKLWDAITIRNLTIKDFHLYEDGQEQKLQRVDFQPPAFRMVKDNLGKHPEILGTGGGLWSYPDLPPSELGLWLAWPQYVIAYAPPQSPLGSCHQIRVQVERKNLTVWNRSEYCNTPHPANDPLNGTELGNKLEKAAATPAQNDIDLKLGLAAFPESEAGARVYLTTSFPWQSLRYEFRGGLLYASIGLLAMIYKKDGSLAARYSDFACCDYGEKKHPSADEPAPEAPSVTGRELPNRYDCQFVLPPGEYNLRVVLTDGVHFGVKNAPLKVDAFDASRLEISDVAVSRRVRKVVSDVSGASTQVADSYAPLISKGVEFTPAANPNFFPDEMLFAYFEIRDPVTAPQEAKVVANLKIVDVNSGALADSFTPVDTETYRNASSPVIPVGRGLLLNHLAPGSYRLDVQASDASGETTAWRSASFTVMSAAPLELNTSSPPAKEP